MAKFESDEEEIKAFDQELKESMNRWRRVFATTDGKEVLIDIVGKLGGFKTGAPTVEEILRQNILKWIFSMLGIMVEGQQRELVGALLRIEPIAPKASDFII